MTTDILLVNAIVGILIPLLVQLLAKAKAVGWVKSLLSLALSGLASVLVPLVTQPSIDWKVAALSFVQMFTLAVVSHYGILKPTGVTGSEGLIATTVPGGLGTEEQPVA